MIILLSALKVMETPKTNLYTYLANEVDPDTDYYEFVICNLSLFVKLLLQKKI